LAAVVDVVRIEQIRGSGDGKFVQVRHGAVLPDKGAESERPASRQPHDLVPVVDAECSAANVARKLAERMQAGTLGPDERVVIACAVLTCGQGKPDDRAAAVDCGGRVPRGSSQI